MSNQLQVVEMAVFDSSGLTGSFAGMNLAASYTIYTDDGFPDSIKVLKIYNASNVGITVSYDGTTQQDFFPAGSHQILDIQANHASNSTGNAGTLNGKKGQIIYGKGSAGVGNFYIIGYR